jgi:hypothetical protein
MLGPYHWLAGIRVLGGSLRAMLSWAAQHTGLPVVLIAAIALVGSWHMFKRSLRFAIEVALTATFLVVLAKLGLLRW